MTKQVLVIEKEGIVAMDLKKTLQSFGYSVPQVALNGKAVLNAAATTKPDLVIMDEKMKAESQEEISKAEKTFQKQHIPIVYLTTRAHHTLPKNNGIIYHYLKKTIQPHRFKKGNNSCTATTISYLMCDFSNEANTDLIIRRIRKK